MCWRSELRWGLRDGCLARFVGAGGQGALRAGEGYRAYVAA